jgi:hypothetical protein
LVNITGSLTYGGTLQVQLTGTPVAGDTWNLFDFTVPWDSVSRFANDAVFGTAGDGTNLPTQAGNLAWGFAYNDGQAIKRLRRGETLF